MVRLLPFREKRRHIPVHSARNEGYKALYQSVRDNTPPPHLPHSPNTYHHTYTFLPAIAAHHKSVPHNMASTSVSNRMEALPTPDSTLTEDKLTIQHTANSDGTSGHWSVTGTLPVARVTGRDGEIQVYATIRWDTFVLPSTGGGAPECHFTLASDDDLTGYIPTNRNKEWSALVTDQVKDLPITFSDEDNKAFKNMITVKDKLKKMQTEFGSQWCQRAKTLHTDMVVRKSATPKTKFGTPVYVSDSSSAQIHTVQFVESSGRDSDSWTFSSSKSAGCMHHNRTPGLLQVNPTFHLRGYGAAILGAERSPKTCKTVVKTTKLGFMKRVDDWYDVASFREKKASEPQESWSDQPKDREVMTEVLRMLGVARFRAGEAWCCSANDVFRHSSAATGNLTAPSA